MAKKPKRQKHYFRFGGFGGAQTVNIAVPCENARWNVLIKRTKKACISGKPGIAIACANAQAASASNATFPHDVFFAEFIRNYAFVVDRLNKMGQPIHCYRYQHDDGDFIKKYDKAGGKAKLVRSSEAERDVHLFPPYYERESKHGRRSQQGSGAPMGKEDGSRSKPKSDSGAVKRAIDAGWINRPQAQAAA